MKVRTGFVSNSSSSSFVIFYRPATIKEIEDEHVHIIGDDVTEGRDYFRPDPKTIEWIKKHPEFFDEGDYYRKMVYEYYSVSEDGEERITTEELISKFPPKQKIDVEVLTVDYYSSNEWTYFEQTYLNNEEE